MKSGHHATLYGDVLSLKKMIFDRLLGQTAAVSSQGNPVVSEANLEILRQTLATLIDPDTGKDYIASKCVKNLQWQAGVVSLDLVLGYPAQSQFAARQAQISAALLPLADVDAVNVNVSSVITAHAVARGLPLQQGIKNIIAVASGKGVWANRPRR